jgi:hypothetical protein
MNIISKENKTHIFHQEPSQGKKTMKQIFVPVEVVL